MVFRARLNKKEINQLAKDYKLALEKSGYPVEKLILFGSYSKGKVHDWSDLDFLVVSSFFDKKNDFDVSTKVNIIGAEISPLIESHIASIKEFNKPDAPWLQEAKRYGKEIL